MKKILCIVGARPNFMKMAPIYEKLAQQKDIKPILLHTGQHYDSAMSKIFFEELGMPAPAINLEVGSGTQAEQTAKIMLSIEPILKKEKPDVVLVVGDVNSTLAAAVVAAKEHIPIAHIEAGLRSFNWEMPEEINRVVTDRLSQYLFCTEKSAIENLKAEGVPQNKIFFVGNTMIDTLLKHKTIAEKKQEVLQNLSIQKGEYALVTLHRPEAVDKKDILSNLVEALDEVQSRIPIIWPIHPRTLNKIKEFGFESILHNMPNLQLIEPRGYLEFLCLQIYAKVVLTDSGGIQEETTTLGVPCLTLRGETERPVTVNEGTNILVGIDKARIVAETMRVLAGHIKKGRIPELWDGKASSRIVEILLQKLSSA